MDERLTDEGIEHLQAAARELISAARVLLDVVEDLVEEPERITSSLSGVVETIRDLAARPVQPWEKHAWAGAAAQHPFDEPVDGVDVDGMPSEQDGDPADGPAPLDGDTPEDSDWAVWDDDEDTGRPASPVVDIRKAGRRRPDGVTSEADGRNGSARKRTGAVKSKNSNVKRITVD